MEEWCTGRSARWICWNCGGRSWQISIGSTKASANIGRGDARGFCLLTSVSRLLSPVFGLPARHHHDSGIRNGIAAGAVLLFVIADDARFRDFDARVDDGAPDTAVAPDLDVGHQNRILDLAITVHPHTGGEDAAHHPAPGNDARSE